MNIKIYAKGRANSYDAKGFLEEDGKVTVLAGSKIGRITGQKYNLLAGKKRDDPNLVSEARIVKKDITFESPSTAATFVVGYIANGYRVWKIDGQKKFIQH